MLIDGLAANIAATLPAWSAQCKRGVAMTVDVGFPTVSLPVEVSCNGSSFRNFMLFTHRGLSGPAILQISSYWQPGDDASGADHNPGLNCSTSTLRPPRSARSTSSRRASS